MLKGVSQFTQTFAMQH